MKHATVLDIGSSKVVSICAGRVGKDGMAVYGADIRPYTGYRNGKFLDEQDLIRVIIESLEATQRECGFRVREVAIAVPAPFSLLYVGTGSITFETKPKRISDADIDMLINVSLPPEPIEGYSLMHSTPFSYTLDGSRRPDLPMDVTAVHVEAEISHYYANDAFLDLVYEALKQLGISSMCVSASLAEALFIVPERERLSTQSVLLDVGYTHTDVCLVQQSAIVAQETVEVGGLHFANDLAYGLEVGLSVAEPVKRRYVFGLDYQDSVELVRTPEGTRSVERAYIQYIVEERALEFCDLIYAALIDIGVDVARKPVIYLAGGGVAMMRGSREYLEHRLGLAVRKDMPWMPRMNSPNYASAFGVLEFMLHTGGEDALSHQVEVGMLQRLRNFFVK